MTMASFLKSWMEKPQESTELSRSASGQQVYMATSLSQQSNLNLDKLSSRLKTPTLVYVLTFFAAIGGFLFGYDTGVVSGAILLLREEFHLSSVWQEVLIGVAIGMAAVFSLVGGAMNETLGRKPVIILASLIFLLGSIFLALSPSIIFILIGRIVIGSGIGLTSTTVNMYIAECAPAHTRGRLVAFNMVMVAAGQFTANVIDSLFSSTPEGWRYMLGIAAVPAVVQFCGFLFMPESPRWLITRGAEDQARLTLQKIRGEDDIEEEFENIKQSYWDSEQEEMTKRRGPTIWQMWCTPSIRRTLIIGCSLQMIQQIAGINTIMYYSATIIRMSGITDDPTAIWLSAVTAAFNLLFTILGLYLVEKVGRRPLTIASLAGAVVSLVWLAVGFNMSALHSPVVTYQELSMDQPCANYHTCLTCIKETECGFCFADLGSGAVEGSCLPSHYNDYLASTLGRCNGSRTHTMWAYDYCPNSYAWMCMVGLVLYLICFAPGMSPMPWTINSEIYPLWARSTGNAAATFTNWISNLVISMSILSLMQVLTNYGTFWLYAGLTGMGTIFLSLFLPETKGKSLEELDGLFAKPWFGSQSEPIIPYSVKSVQYLHIRGLNKNSSDSESD